MRLNKKISADRRRGGRPFCHRSRASLNSRARRTRPERIAGQPNINGIWQAMNSANWNLEAHSAQALKEFWGARLARCDPGRPERHRWRRQDSLFARSAHATRRASRGLAEVGSGDELLSARHSARHLHAVSVPDRARRRQILFVYTYASTNRLVNMGEPIVPPVDTWMGQSNGRWDGNTLVVETTGFNGMTPPRSVG